MTTTIIRSRALRPAPPAARTALRFLAALLASVACAVGASAGPLLVDRGGGLIYDPVLDITWLQDANYGAGSIHDDGSSATDGRMTYDSAIAWADELAYYDPVRDVTWSDWRLPTLSPLNGVDFIYSDSNDGSTDEGVALQGVGWGTTHELGHLYYVSLNNRSDFFSSSLGNYGPFINVQPFIYWEDRDYEVLGLEDWVWYFNMDRGLQDAGSKEFFFYAWAVRDGDVGAVVTVPEPSTLSLLGFVMVGVLAVTRRRVRPHD